MVTRWRAIPNIADIIAAHADQDKTLRESAAELGAMILEMEREEECHGKHSKRLAELKRARALQEKVVLRMLDGSIEGGDRSERPTMLWEHRMAAMIR